MIAQIKAEFRKLSTIRSTYIVLIIAVVLIAAVNFWGVGYKFAGQAPPSYMADALINSLSATGILAGIVALLLVTHEYRYNTIYYTLATVRSRTTVLLAKAAVITVFALAFTVLMAAVSVLAAQAGLFAGDHTLPNQSYAVWQLAWRGFGFVWAISMLALVLAFIVRNQIGSIVLFLMIPTTVEGIASIFLKENVAYLPFTALGNLVMTQPLTFSYTKSAGIALVWIAVGYIVSWVLFTRRDAN